MNPMSRILACAAIAAGTTTGCLSPYGGGGSAPAGSPSGASDPGSSNGTGSSNGASSGAVYYYEDALPVFQKNCMPCHVTGGSGTPALDSYASASGGAMAILAAIQNGTMPPYPPTEHCNHYVDELRMSDADQQTILSWVQGGALEGNPAAGTAFTPTAPTLGTPDRVLSGTSFTPTYPSAAGAEDLYWCFPLDPKVTVATDLIAVEVIPGQQNEVHHVILSRDRGGTGTAGKPATGFECDGVPGSMIYGWVPGARPFQLPAGVGMTLAPSDRLYMQVHYHHNPSVTPSPDVTKANLYFAKSTQAQHAYTVWTGSWTFVIPPNSTDVPVNAACAVNGNWQIIGVAPHMHEYGTKFNLTVTPQGGVDQCVMNINRWNFNWQGGYMLQQPISVHPGDWITTHCSYNNPTAATIPFGESTGDEMCFGFLTVIAPSEPIFPENPGAVVSGLYNLCGGGIQ